MDADFVNRANVEDDFFTPGRIVPAGRYIRIGAIPERTIELDRAGRLPASLDGQVALYRRLPAQEFVIPSSRSITTNQPSSRVRATTA